MTDKCRNEDDDETREFPVDGPWRAIFRGRDRTTYYPRNPSHLPRFEWTLPSGHVLIDDIRKGCVIRQVYSARFNFDDFSPVGRALGDRAIMKRQDLDEQWFVSSYQEHYDSEDQLVSSCLAIVEEHRGRTLIAQHELGGKQSASEAPPN